MISKLKPCPFCGRRAIIVYYPHKPVYCVCCSDDSCLGTSTLRWSYDSREEAIAAWNTRTERACKWIDTLEIETECDAWTEKKCSCGEWIDVTHRHRPKYCPRCGAKVAE